MHPAIGAAGTLVVILASVTFCYFSTCWIWPFTACRKCEGTGRRRSPSGRAFRYCHRCKGTGARLRFGRRVLNLIRRLHRDATR